MASRTAQLAKARAAHDIDVEPAELPVVQVQALSRSFDGRVVLDSLGLEIAPGAFVALLGRSGSGKSTLLRALAGLDRGVSGELIVQGEVAVAFQDPRLLPWRKVLENVCLGLRTADPAALARNALDEVGLGARQDAWPLTLSGGEAQRASLARALVRGPDLLLLDEPFSALDALTRMAMHDLVLRLWAHHGPAILLVTHDVEEAVALADRILVLRDGRIAHESSVDLGRPRDLFHHDLVSMRTRLLAELGIHLKGTV